MALLKSQTINRAAENVRPGGIELICGCMFAGKTAALIERLRAAEASGLRVIAFKHSTDHRYAPTELATHDGRRFPAKCVANAEAIVATAGDADVIGLDEGQFFGDGLPTVARRLRDSGRRVVVAGIDFNVWGKPFEALKQLKAIADRVESLRIPCTKCGRPAPFTQRMTPVLNGDWVGGPGDYEPRCPDCFHRINADLTPSE